MAETPQPTATAAGLLPSQELRRLVGEGAIRAAAPIAEAQIQPASLDLRLGPKAWRIRASFLPGAGARVEDKLARFAMHEIELAGGAVLETTCVYLVKLVEELALGPELLAVGNPKSSIGRLDVFTRLITDGASEFDHVESGYRGPLYAEISPLAFSIVVRAGSRLCQLRVKRGRPSLGHAELHRLQAAVREEEGAVADALTYRGGFPITVDVRGDSQSGLVGYKARKHTPLVDVDKTGYYDPADFWEEVRASRRLEIVLDPDDFYILASKEPVAVPPDHAAEMVAYDTLVGEFRVHYAGFFDPGFGHAKGGGAGARAVLEVRSHEVPFVIEDGQLVGRLMYEKLAAVPDKLYGAPIGSSYQRQGLALSRQFRR